MGKIKENLLTKGFSGRVGDEMVFRQVDGETRVMKLRKKREFFTPKEQAVKDRFVDSTIWAKSELADPETRAYYELNKKLFRVNSAYAAAVSDFLTMPKIGRVNVQNYKGIIGNGLYIVPVNNVKIFDMQIKILRADGTLVESGAAVKSKDYWTYEAKTANPDFAGGKVIVTAKDRPGKTVTFESAL